MVLPTTGIICRRYRSIVKLYGDTIESGGKNDHWVGIIIFKCSMYLNANHKNN